MPLEEESREFVTVNSHIGHYKYTQLPFGIASAPAIFQRAMDTILQGLHRVLCYVDDILVTCANDDVHLHNPEEVLTHLRTHEIRVKSKKCLFFQESAKYLGHKIRAKDSTQPPRRYVDAVRLALAQESA